MVKRILAELRHRRVRVFLAATVAATVVTAAMLGVSALVGLEAVDDTSGSARTPSRGKPASRGGERRQSERRSASNGSDARGSDAMEKRSAEPEGGGKGQADKAVPKDLDLARASVADLERTLSRGTVTSVALVRAYLARIEALDADGPSLNAVRALNPRATAQARQSDRERSTGQVRGPLHGIPVLVKDNIDVDGMPTTAGALALKDSRPSSDAFVVTRLRQAGAIVLGKTNLTEFANFTTWGMPSGYSGLGGQVVNPYDDDLSPSGSSSGSAVAAAAALAPVTVGTETFGSILSPAVVNSLVGVKPTVGLISRTGIVPIAASQDTPGPMARSVSDAATLLTALVGRDAEDPATGGRAGTVGAAGVDYTKALSRTALRGARIGLASTPEGNEGDAFAAAADVFEEEGATVVDVTVHTDDLPPEILTYEFKRDLNAYLRGLPADAPVHDLEDIVRFNRAHADDGAIRYGQDRLLAANDVDLDDPEARARYEGDRDEGIAVARDRIDSVLAGQDLDAIAFIGSGSSAIGARAQYPSVAVPIGYDPDTGHPIGMTLLGTAYAEARLLGLAYSYEQGSQLWRPPSDLNRAAFR